ncbi:hypothetical protein LTR47_007183 [Exophiala xenobiotica]|nr:hypothetical protein LTR41_002510 [Exophiala xenobiotica]KAK5231780.1 hypothetical protein LTR47_007183 [Exophiala xenobiotica]KAK5248938.1 hypothetical protein LTS06_006123 [Exophiala xenobiotica]KAK5348190.1 hypothetical protein LTR61_008048 [Exophiala xenobiotica]KAK5362688.1 hypothetical protein LTR11_009378 [Exophiala xenobiotica]
MAALQSVDSLSSSGAPSTTVVSPSLSASGHNGPRNLLVHLPAGPSLNSPSFDALPQLHGQLLSNTSLVTVNYRLGLGSDNSTDEKTSFPTPVHDVSTALGYLTSSTSPFNEGHDEPPRICLVGSHIGGALATMLALTEPNGIHALAVHEPTVDWVSLDEIVEQLRGARLTPRQRQKQKITRFGVDDASVLAAAEDLVKLRAKLFPTPSSYFDPFASPLLFLRAPGRDTPLEQTVGDQLVNEMGLNDYDGGFRDSNDFGPYDDDWQQGGPTRSTLNTRSSSPAPIGSELPFASSETAGTRNDGATLVSDIISPPTSATPQSPTRRRKVLQRWPPVGRPESVMLPYVKVFVQATSNPPDIPGSEAEAVDMHLGHAALMRAQGAELVELMRRACFFGREKSFAEERVRLYEESAHAGEPDTTRTGGFEGAGDIFTHSSLRLQSEAVKWAEHMLTTA